MLLELLLHHCHLVGICRDRRAGCRGVGRSRGIGPTSPRRRARSGRAPAATAGTAIPGDARCETHRAPTRHHAALRRNAGIGERGEERAVVDRNAPEGTMPALAVAVQHQIANDQFPLQRHPDRAGIQDVPAPDPPVQRQVPVRRHNRLLRYSVQQEHQFRLVDCRDDPLAIGARRAMQGSRRRIGRIDARGVGPGRDARVQRPHELTAEPGEHRILRRIDPGGRSVRRVVIEQIELVIPPDDRPSCGQCAFHDRRRERPPVDQVARYDDPIDREGRESGQHNFQAGKLPWISARIASLVIAPPFLVRRARTNTDSRTHGSAQGCRAQGVRGVP